MFPLRDATQHNPTMGGWEYGDWSTYTNSVHAGVDFNCGGGGDADLGSPLIAVCPMVLRASVFSGRGFGNHQWWEVSAGPHEGKWVHYAHADSFIYGQGDIGVAVKRGDEIGKCGKSGGQQFAHLHFEVKLGHPMEWGYWGGELKTKEQVDNVYMNPIQFCADYDEHCGSCEQCKCLGSIDPFAEFGISTDDAPKYQALLDAVREINYIDHAEAVVRIIAGLNANETSVEGWINQIGALKSELANG
jgi:hypothetical protein